MNKQGNGMRLAGAAVGLLAYGGLMAGGYELMHRVNDTPQEEVEQARARQDALTKQYIHLGSTACQQHVLETFVLGYGVAKDGEVVERVLDSTCDGEAEHAVLAKNSVAVFEDLADARAAVDDKLDSSEYSWDEKLLGVVLFPTLISGASVALSYGSLRSRRRNRTARERHGLTLRDQRRIIDQSRRR